MREKTDSRGKGTEEPPREQDKDDQEGWSRNTTEAQLQRHGRLRVIKILLLLT